MSSSEGEDDEHRSSRNSPSQSDSDNDDAHQSPDAPSDAEPLPHFIPFNLSLNPAQLPPLDAINFKFSQIMDSITSLQRLIQADDERAMTTWPVILAQYNLLLSQTHTLSASLSPSVVQQNDRSDPRIRRPPLSTLPALVVHPTAPTREDRSDDQRVETLLRTMLVPEMVEQENKTVQAFGHKLPEDEQVEECKELERIRDAHDSKVARLLELVHDTKDQYKWKTRNVKENPKPPPVPLPVLSPHAAPMPVTLELPGDGMDIASEFGEEDGSDLFGEGTGESGDVDMNQDDSAETNTSDEAFLLEADLEDDPAASAAATPSEP